MSRKALSFTVVGGLSIIIVLQIISLGRTGGGSNIQADDGATLALLDDEKVEGDDQAVMEDPRLLAIGALGASHVYTMYGYIGVMADGYVGVTVNGENHRIYSAQRISELTPEISTMCNNCQARLVFLVHGEDSNMNGVLDLGEDSNMNGILDRGEDVDRDSVLDHSEDVDGDGVLDPGIDLIPEDRAVVEQMSEIYGLLSQQAQALERFVESNSPEDAEEFELKRTTVWPEIAGLLGIEE